MESSFFSFTFHFHLFPQMYKGLFLSLIFNAVVLSSMAATGTWSSPAVGAELRYETSVASGKAATDYSGKPMTIVYLENLGFQKIGQNTNAEDVAWLRGQGYQVIELDYAHSENAVSPIINKDIIAINDALLTGSFCGCTCSLDRSYILMEGYRIQRDIAYYLDDPTVYNYPDIYKDSQGDSLYLDLVYPANPSVKVPTLVTFSYSNSYATLKDGKLNDSNKHKRMYLGNAWGGQKDSFVEGAAAIGMAWAICDHPKYCDWGRGNRPGGAQKEYGAIEVNPDAARKVKSAIRTVKAIGSTLGFSDRKVAVTGFSRGSTAASLAVGNANWPQLEQYGLHQEESSSICCAVLGSGMFDYSRAMKSSNEYIHINTYVTANPDWGWDYQGALSTIQRGSAPCLFYHNRDDFYRDNNKDPEGLYATQAAYMKAKLDEVGVESEFLTDYSTGHAVPRSQEDLQKMYDFLRKHLSGSNKVSEVLPENVESGLTFDLLGRRYSNGARATLGGSRSRKASGHIIVL